MANLGRVSDIFGLLVPHPVCSLEGRVNEHVDVLVYRAGNEKPFMFCVIRSEVGTASTERNPQRGSTEDDAHFAETVLIVRGRSLQQARRVGTSGPSRARTGPGPSRASRA